MSPRSGRPRPLRCGATTLSDLPRHTRSGERSGRTLVIGGATSFSRVARRGRITRSLACDTRGVGLGESSPLAVRFEEARRLLRSLLRMIAMPTGLVSDEVESLIETRDCSPAHVGTRRPDRSRTTESNLDRCRAVCGQVMADFAAAVSNAEIAAADRAESLVSITTPTTSLSALRKALSATTTLTSGDAEMVIKKRSRSISRARTLVLP